MGRAWGEHQASTRSKPWHLPKRCLLCLLAEPATPAAPFQQLLLPSQDEPRFLLRFRIPSLLQPVVLGEELPHGVFCSPHHSRNDARAHLARKHHGAAQAGQQRERPFACQRSGIHMSCNIQESEFERRSQALNEELRT